MVPPNDDNSISNSTMNSSGTSSTTCSQRGHEPDPTSARRSHVHQSSHRPDEIVSVPVHTRGNGSSPLPKAVALGFELNETCRSVHYQTRRIEFERGGRSVAWIDSKVEVPSPVPAQQQQHQDCPLTQPCTIPMERIAASWLGMPSITSQESMSGNTTTTSVRCAIVVPVVLAGGLWQWPCIGGSRKDETV
jgi:hypothetical protein